MTAAEKFCTLGISEPQKNKRKINEEPWNLHDLQGNPRINGQAPKTTGVKRVTFGWKSGENSSMTGTDQCSLIKLEL